jgi:hypothetical protein
MVRYSDNNAVRLVADALPPGEVDRTLLALGLLDEFRSTGGKLSVKSASSFFRVLYNASYLGREMSELALAMLSRSSFRDGLLAAVPGDVAACSKYGEAEVGPGLRELHEFAIVYHPRHTYLLGAMTQGRDFQEMARLLRDISRLVYADVADDAIPADPSAVPLPTP